METSSDSRQNESTPFFLSWHQVPVVSHLFPSSLPVIKTGITPPSTPQSRLLRVFSGFSGYFIPSSAASLRTVCNVKCSPAVTVDQFDNRIASKRSQPTPTIMTSRPPSAPLLPSCAGGALMFDDCSASGAS